MSTSGGGGGGGGGYSGGGGGGGGGGGAIASNGGGGAPSGGDNLVGVDGMPATQWALYEREAWMRLRSDLSERVVDVRSDCGGQVVAGYVYESFRGQTSPDNAPWGIPSYAAGGCPAAVYALRDMCVASAMQRQSVQSQVQRVECSWGTPNVTFANGIVHVTLDNSVGTAFYSEHTTSALQSGLH